MVEQIASWVVSLIIMAEISYIVYLNIIQVVSRRKCRKKRYCKPFKPCHESDCKFAGYCEKYEHVCTDEEIESLKKLIDKMQN